MRCQAFLIFRCTPQAFVVVQILAAIFCLKCNCCISREKYFVELWGIASVILKMIIKTSRLPSEITKIWKTCRRFDKSLKLEWKFRSCMWFRKKWLKCSQNNAWKKFSPSACSCFGRGWIHGTRIRQGTAKSSWLLKRNWSCRRMPGTRKSSTGYHLGSCWWNRCRRRSRIETGITLQEYDLIEIMMSKETSLLF